MSGKTTSMSKIKQMLLLLQASKGVKSIASITGISRNTIKSYKVRLEKMDASIDDLLLLDDPVLESVFHAGNPAYSDKRFDTLKLLLDDYIKELESPRNHLTRFTLWQEYRSEHPDGYGYSQFCFHLGQHQSASHPTMVLSSTPGDKLLVDFAGDTLSYVCALHEQSAPAASNSKISKLQIILVKQCSKQVYFSRGCKSLMHGVVPEALASRKLVVGDDSSEGSETAKSGTDEQKRYMRHNCLG